jgi:protein-disulfide isomerase
VILWLGIFGLMLAAPQSGFAQTSGDGASELKQEIQALKQILTAIQSDLQKIRKVELPEIKKLAAARGGSGGRERVSDLKMVMSLKDVPYLGEKDARLTLVEFSDFQCPFCARHNKNTLPKLVQEFVDTGKVKYVMRDFPLGFHKQAHGASVAAWCANEQGKFWELHHLMFANQRKLNKADLEQHAVALGLDMPAFQSCTASGKYDKIIASSMKDGQKAGVRGTPSFVLGYTQADGTEIKVTRFMRGAQPFEAFKKEIDKLLAAE